MSSALALPGLSDDKSGFRKHVRGPDGPKLFREEPDCLRWGVDFRGQSMNIMEVLWGFSTAVQLLFSILFHCLSHSCSYLFLQKAKKLLDKHCKVDVANEWQAVDEPLQHRFLQTPLYGQLHLLRFHVRPGCWGEECKQWNWRILAFQSVRVRVGLHVRNCETLRIIRLPSFVGSWRVCRKRTNPLSCWRWKARTQKISN